VQEVVRFWEVQARVQKVLLVVPVAVLVVPVACPSVMATSPYSLQSLLALTNDLVVRVGMEQGHTSELLLQ
jgi:uncharacterized membrane protein